jgi:hypothetical protein
MKRLILLSILAETAGTKVGIIINDKTHLEIILWVRARSLGLVIVNKGGFFHFQDLGQLASALTRLEQVGGDDEALEISLIIFLFLCLTIWWDRGGRVGGRGSVGKTQ